jgi:hypothetical protein
LRLVVERQNGTVIADSHVGLKYQIMKELHLSIRSVMRIPSDKHDWFLITWRIRHGSSVPEEFSMLLDVYQPLDNLWQLDLNPMLEHGEFFRYTGAMTYPPCNEEPVMFVRRNPHNASDAQVKLFHDLIFETNMGVGNYRSVLPLNNKPQTQSYQA